MLDVHSLQAEPFRVADIWVTSALNDPFIEGVDPTASRSIKQYLIVHHQVNLTSIDLRARALLAIQMDLTKPPLNKTRKASTKFLEYEFETT